MLSASVFTAAAKRPSSGGGPGTCELIPLTCEDQEWKLCEAGRPGAGATVSLDSSSKKRLGNLGIEGIEEGEAPTGLFESADFGDRAP
mmetsp:Transcript_12400/g.22112  ORF Transcript_12400/g.22112 Transcript_12400/m.22112 type:complete len:88 (+) Transcript_12400:190-453(+)